MASQDLETKEKNCEICKVNLKTKRGTCIATVPLFSETTNKEFSSTLRGKSVILSKLLHSVGIIISQESHRRFVCVKCARKVVNCYKLFAELQQVFISKSSNSSQESSEEIQITFTTYERSPTGITPKGKARQFSSFSYS
jgi:hypothetical protein